MASPMRIWFRISSLVAERGPRLGKPGKLHVHHQKRIEAGVPLLGARIECNQRLRIYWVGERPWPGCVQLDEIAAAGDVERDCQTERGGSFGRLVPPAHGVTPAAPRRCACRPR